jgi:hypothetical protein
MMRRLAAYQVDTPPPPPPPPTARKFFLGSSIPGISRVEGLKLIIRLTNSHNNLIVYDIEV